MTDLPLRKLAEDAKTITLGWDPVGDRGYRFSRSAGGGKFSNTWDASRSGAKFSKDSDWYKVEALGLVAEGVYPPPVTPPPPTLTVASSIGDGQALSGQVSWQATPSAAVSKVEFLIDGVVRWQENLAPYVFNGDGNLLDTATLENGSHVFAVKATAADGTVATASATVTVQNTAPPPPPSSTTGKPLFFCKMDGSTDGPMDNPANQAWFLSHWHRAVGYITNRWDWFEPQTHLYVDLVAIYNPNHPSHSGAPTPNWAWVLKDSAGTPLFIPWGSVVNNQLPQYAADQGHPDYITYMVGRCKNAIAAGHKGVHLDDVNMHINTAYGNSSRATPINPRTGKAMTDLEWQQDTNKLLAAIRAALPNNEISHNSRWFDGANHTLGDAQTQQQTKLCDWVTIERGIIDGGLQGGTGEWSIDRLLKYCDAVHALGTAVVWMSYAGNAADHESNLAAYWLTRDHPDDMVGSNMKLPASWQTVTDLDLGAPKGARTYSGGVHSREFAKGRVTLTDARVGKVTFA